MKANVGGLVSNLEIWTYYNVKYWVQCYFIAMSHYIAHNMYTARKSLPHATSLPDHVFFQLMKTLSFPSIGFTIDEEDLCTAGELAGVLNARTDYI